MLSSAHKQSIYLIKPRELCNVFWKNKQRFQESADVGADGRASSLASDCSMIRSVLLLHGLEMDSDMMNCIQPDWKQADFQVWKIPKIWG